MTEQTLENTRTVEVFLHALQDADLDTAGAALAEDLVYQNVGLPTIHGRRRAMKLFSSLGGASGFEVKIHRIAADGAAVLTERTDALIFGPLRLQFWVCGVFEVHDGQITLVARLLRFLRHVQGNPARPRGLWWSRRCGRRSDRGHA